MDEITYQYLKENPELLRFIRYNPVWYRYLSRDPQKVRELPKEAKEFYGYTTSQRLEKLNNQVQMVGMLIQLAEAMKD